ncbi:MAG: DUF2061 domain-containing protein [Gammaproteobacteria bacterium]|nr:DUF2061 domain-containing protein [Gammaproteobacteria bacterium]
MAEIKQYQGESNFRIWLKAISWRVLGTLTTFGVTFSITNSLNVATSVGAFEFFAKTILFYLHEKLWIKINTIF